MQKEIVEGYRLSPQQRRLCWLSKAEGSTPYRSQCALLVEGGSHLDHLEVVLDDVVAKNEILRTTFKRLPGLNTPVQVINDCGTLQVERFDLSALSRAKQQAEIERLFQDMKRVAFDLETGPLLHVKLVKLAVHESVLMLGLPALCTDLTGLTNILDEVSLNHANGLPGKSTGSPPPIQYADISAYLAELLESEETAAGRRYWSNFRMSDYPELRLPFENQSVEANAFAPESLRSTIDPSLIPLIESAARKYDTTVSVFLLACWQVLLWRLTEQARVLIGVAFPGREVEGLEKLPGLFERYLPFAGQLESQLKFNELLKQLDESSARLVEWQDYFQWDFFFLDSPDGQPATQFFPICFEFDNRLSKSSPQGITRSLIKQYACTERFKLKMSCRLEKDSLATELHYDSHLFSVEDMECLIEQFQVLLSYTLNHLESPIDTLEFLSDSARKSLLVDFNRTKVDQTQIKIVHQEIALQAARTPHRPAVVFGHQQLSYAELNGRADHLAQHLRRLGVGPEVLVVVCLERSLELMVAILGILKAGGAYVPLDPAYPAQRLDFILKQTAAPVLLTQERFRSNFVGHRAQVLCLDTEWATIACEPQDAVAIGISGENLAYVIYTSGSTGQPKGVMVTHKGLMNYLAWAGAAYRVAEGQGAPLHSSIGFDLTVTSLFLPLLSGESVTLLESDESPEALAEVLRQGKEFSLVKITPSHLQILNQLLKADEVERATNALIIGGENLFAESLSFWRSYSPQTRIINEYGPTETVVGCCVFEVEPGSNLHGAVPIGKSIANTQIYILDQRLEPVPQNVMGEIYIGGEGVARGYLGQADLTAERFIPNPYAIEPGSLLYRTGDLGRHRTKHGIEYCGRIDQQVKIRGYRIELGEIEAVLIEHARVSEAVVVVNDELAEKRLVGYLVVDGPGEFDTSQIKDYLKERLPDYMIPAVFVRLDKLPLTPNGKVDRRALPAPDTENAGLGNYVEPRTEVERLLAGLWAKAFGLERVGINDDFFALGGDSILSIQLANRAKSLGVGFAPRQIFRYRTIGELAAALEPAKAPKAEQGISTGAIQLTPIQHWFFEHDFIEAHYWNQAIMLETSEKLDAGILERVLQNLLVHHDALRLRFVRDESGWQQFATQPNGEKLLQEHDLSTLAEADRASALKEISASLQASLNLTEGRLVRAAIVDVGQRKGNLLLIVIHHLAVDIVSWSILLEEIETAYRQISAEQPVQLPLKSSSFKDWAQRLTQYANTPKLRRELAFWTHEARRKIRPVPVDFPGGDNTEASTRKFSVSLPRTETKDLLQEVPRVAGTMINDLLLTALAMAFSRWTQSSSLLIDLENHGREEIFDDIDLTRTVGWFTCIFPMLLDLEGTHDPGEALQAIKRQVRHVPNGGIGYGLLRYLNEAQEISAQLKALPRAEISFNYVGRFSQSYSETSLFVAAREFAAPSHSPRGIRPHVLELNGGIDTQGQLQMVFTYSQNLHRRSTIERFGEGFVRALMDILEETLLANAPQHNPSGFLVGNMSQMELEKLMAELGEIEAS